MVVNNPQHLIERSVGGVLLAHDHDIDTPDDLGPIEVLNAGFHVVTFSTISTDHLYDRWLIDMQADGYQVPNRSNEPRADRSQRDLDVLRSMHTAGVPQDTAQAALEAGSDKAQGRDSRYLEHLISTVWGEPWRGAPNSRVTRKCGVSPHGRTGKKHE
jgi:hypothetical protein